MIKQEVLVDNELGLHARAAAKLVRLASRYSSDIHLCRMGVSEQVDSKSILGILMLGASRGTRITFSIDGPDEVEAADAIRRFFEKRFGEER